MKAVKKHFIAIMGKESLAIGNYNIAKGCLEFVLDNKKMDFSFNYLSLMHMRIVLARTRTILHDEYVMLEVARSLFGEQIDIKPLLKEVEFIYELFMKRVIDIFTKGDFDMTINYLGDICIDDEDDMIDLEDAKDLFN